jgi:hypothetical protein
VAVLKVLVLKVLVLKVALSTVLDLVVLSVLVTDVQLRRWRTVERLLSCGWREGVKTLRLSWRGALDQ